MERPVVFNSLLTFVHNYRDNPRLPVLIQEYFSKTAVEDAYTALCDHLGTKGTMVLPEELVSLYDEMSCKGTLPLFAATDLSCLPLALLGPDNDRNELLKEMRKLKRFIHDALNGKIDDPLPTTRPSEDISTRISRHNLHTSASSPEFPSIPVTPSIITQACEPVKPVLPLPESPVTLNSVASVSPRNQLKRKNTMKSLDAAVKKLTDRQIKSEQRESVSPVDWPSKPLNMQLDPQAYLNMIRLMHTPQTSLFPILTTHSLNTDDKDDSGDMGMDDDKHFDDSSPSPSEDIKDEFDMSGNDIDKPFVCEHSNCQKRFANKFLLKKHQFIHTGLRPHTCPYCSKRFNRKDNLLRHKKTHLQNGLDLGGGGLNLFMTNGVTVGMEENSEE